ncbi:autophagy protein Apg9-domain-containing protein [Acrodontium crateriforme]|uniref:Autophagy-related protein 9 n=1 Tax=Acrodontium crateriforme TaxID=150365 RepID=A0AAQ3R3U7_9PEZI|nr:autophagy protein Apg9-domain-containing protein [Acrodontium crateriforme]
MYSSRVLSRLLPVAEGDVSIYESMRRGPRDADIESQRRPSTVGEPFHDEDEDPEALLYDANADRQPSDSTALTPEQRGKERAEEDDDVPESLLLEPSRHPSSRKKRRSSSQTRTAAQWKATQEQHTIYSQIPAGRKPSNQRLSPRHATGTSARPDPQANAMWLYTNANNLDAFLLEVYQYYVEHGVWSILLKRVLSLFTELFVFSFAMFLSTCIDYGKIPQSKKTSEVLIPKCMAKASWIKNAAIFFFVIYWCFKLVWTTGNVKRLFRMHDFYQHVLGINDQDIQTVSWVRVVDGLVKVQNANIATANQTPQARRYAGYNKPQQRMSAESIANRLMRQSNYYVAMYNKDVLDLTLPLPFVGSRQFYSKSLEWCIDFCLTNFIFDEQGSIRPFCLDVKNRSSLVSALQIRLQFAALTSVIIAPFNILRFCIMFFFRYYTEFTRNPSRMGTRTFTPFAEWKIREFNELEHLFQRRLKQAHPFATDYLKQFPKDKMDQAARFVAFISGAIAAMLTLATLFDSELFLGFEITPGRTAFFWLTIMVAIFSIAHGALPDDNDLHDPVFHLRDVLMYTHYMPAHWKDRLHSNEVRGEFSAMYQLKVLLFVEEILSLIVAPWILLRNAGDRSERIVDFFREHTVHVDGIGYQCNFAVFGFKKDHNAEDPTALLNEPDGLRDDLYGLKDDKMAVSVQNFMQYYSHYNHRQGTRKQQGWQPPPSWPPILSSRIITEERELHPGRAPGQQRPASAKRSGTHDYGHLAAHSQKSPIHAARDRRNRAAHSDSTHSNAGLLSPTQPAVSESIMMRQDSDLHDYIGDRSRLESDTDADELDENENPGQNAGVLGMLYQFSKAQTNKGPEI